MKAKFKHRLSSRLLAGLLCLFFYLPSFGQSTCSTSVSVTPTVSACTNTNYLYPQNTTERWYKFVADSSHVKIEITTPTSTPTVVIQTLALYSGTCSGLTLMQEKDISWAGDTAYGRGIMEIEEKYLTTGNTYYIKVKAVSSCSDCPSGGAYFGMCIQNLPAFVHPTVPTCVDPDWDECNHVCNGVQSYWDYEGDCSQLQVGQMLAPPWYNPGGGYPHVFIDCAYNSPVAVPYPDAPVGFQQPCGPYPSGYFGLFTWDNVAGDYRDYLTQLMPKPLIAGRKYWAKMKVALGDAPTFGSNNLGMYFSYNAPYQSGYGVISATPQVNHSTVITDDVNWTNVSGCFTGNGERYLTIGNFYNDANTSSTATIGTGGAYAYYVIGCIEVHEVPGAGRDTSVYCGQPVTLGDNNRCDTVITGETYSWSPAGGLSCTTCAHPVATPSVTTTYIMTATYNGCSYTDTVVVTINPIPVNAGSDQSICKGSSVQLTATGATSYTWSPATGLSCNSCSNPIASPSITTTYTVTGSVTGCAQRTDQILVTVLPKPDGTVTGLDANPCNTDIITYSSANESGVSYTWSVTGGTLLTPSNLSTASVTWPTNGGTITLTAIGSTTPACTTVTTITIPPCCDSPGLYFNNTKASLVLTNPSYIASGYINGSVFSAPLNPVIINGAFTIDVPFEFKAQNVILNTNCKIYIDPLQTLTISDTSDLYACADMWDGVFIKASTSTLIVKEYSRIRQAKNAVVSEAGGAYNIDNARIVDNYKGIVVKPYNGTHGGKIKATTIGKVSGLIAPYLNQPPNVGIEVTSVNNIIIGDSSSAANKNTIKEVLTGIRTDRSSATIINNRITYASTYTSSVAGIECYSTKQAGGTVRIGGWGSNTANDISKISKGVWVRSYMNATIKSNTIDSVAAGIWVNLCRSKNIYVQYNILDHAGIGIKAVDNGLGKTVITFNEINKVTTSATNFMGISVENAVVDKLDLEIGRNEISRNRYGIYVRNVAAKTLRPKVYNNVIDFNAYSNTTIAGGLYVGIMAQKCDSIMINDNTVSRSTAAASTIASKLKGIHVENSAFNIVTYNILTKMGGGIWMRGQNFPSKITCNTMDACYNGVFLQSTNIGHQYNGQPSDNIWNAHSLNRDITGSAVNMTWYYNNSSSSYIPTSNASGVTIFAVANQTSACSPIQNPRSVAQRAFDMEDVVFDSLSYDDYNGARKYYDTKAVYKQMKANPSVLNFSDPSDADYQKWHDDRKGENVGAFEVVIDSIITGNLGSALLQNTSISPSGEYEVNRKSVNKIYLDSWAHDITTLTNEQKTALENIAFQNPISGGDAVYSARVMLDIFPEMVDTTGNLRTAHETGSPSGIQEQVKIYPNPAADEAVLEYAVEPGANAVLELYKPNGQKKQHRTLADGTSRHVINMALLEPGLYVYRVRANGAVIATGKLVIIR